MATPACPQCGRPISGDDINVAKDVAFCRPCNSSSQFSSLLHDSELDAEVDLNQPPEGAWCRLEGQEVALGAEHWQWPIGLVYWGFALVWNALVAVAFFSLIAVTLEYFGVPWFRMDHEIASLGSLVFTWAFLTPFLLIGIVCFIGSVLATWGTTEIHIGEADVLVSIGVGGLRRQWRFDRDAIKRIGIERRLWQDSESDHVQTEIVVETVIGKPIKFGASLSPERRKFVGRSLRKLLLNDQPTTSADDPTISRGANGVRVCDEIRRAEWHEPSR